MAPWPSGYLVAPWISKAREAALDHRLGILGDEARPLVQEEQDQR